MHVIYYRWDCRYTAAVVQACRERFMGVSRIDPESRDAPDSLTLGGRGFAWRAAEPRGGAERRVDQRSNADGRDLERAAELMVPMCILCGTERLPDVERVIRRHDERLDVCIDHMADCPIDQPDELKKLLALAKYKRVYVKLSHLWSLSKEAYPNRDTHDQVRRLYDAFGPERLMWGSDWPVVEKYCGYGRALALYRDEIKFFNDADRRAILGETALRLWPAGEGCP